MLSNTGHGRRHQLNRAYAAEAQAALSDGDDPGPRYVWLFVPKYRTGILAELGRFDDDDEIRGWADVICERKPTTKSAIVAIRRARVGRSPESDAEGLTWAIVRAIGDYAAGHENVDDDLIRKALAGAFRVVGGNDA